MPCVAKIDVVMMLILSPHDAIPYSITNTNIDARMIFLVEIRMMDNANIDVICDIG